MPPDTGTMTARAINGVLSRARLDFAPIQLRVRIKRALLRLGNGQALGENFTGTMLPVPYDQSTLALRPIIGEVAEAVQFYASRFASNPPTVEVMPLTVTDRMTDRLDKLAGKQELFDAVLLDALGIGTEYRRNQRKAAMAQAITDCAYYVLLPRDFTFGVPERQHYTDEQARVLAAAGKRLGPRASADEPYREHADDWQARKAQHNRDRASGHGGGGAQSALGYFDLQAYPRDMVIKFRDSAGIKAAAVIEHIPADDCGPGSELARSWVRANMGKSVNGRRVTQDDASLWGLWKDGSGRIIGGLEVGGPPTSGYSRAGDWTLIRWLDRSELVYLITGGNSIDGGQEIYRVKHGATDQGVPVCPVFEVPAVRTDIESMGSEFIGPMSQVFAYAPLINQLETLFSAAGVWNSTPRFYVELSDGSILRDDNGQPKFFDSAPVPGTDAGQIGAYDGEIHQLLVNTTTIERLLPIYLAQLAAAMPNKAATGDAGSSGAAWLAQQNIQQTQLTIAEPVENHRTAVADILRVAHDYLRRNFDCPLWFFQVPQQSDGQRGMRGLVEFDPADLTDSFAVQQSLDTPEERTVALQIGNELAALGRINDREYFQTYMRVRDAREAIIAMDQQRLVNAWKYGAQTAGIAPDSGMYKFLQMLTANVQYEMTQISPSYALDQARGMAQAAQQSMQAQQQALVETSAGTPADAGQGMGGPVSEAAGVRRPGVGMSTTLAGQLGDQTRGPLPGGGM